MVRITKHGPASAQVNAHWIHSAEFRIPESITKAAVSPNGMASYVWFQHVIVAQWHLYGGVSSVAYELYRWGVGGGRETHRDALSISSMSDNACTDRHATCL